MRRTVTIALCHVLALSDTAIAGGTEDPARELFDRAEVHFNVSEFGQALELYRQAYKLHPLPGFLFNIAQCHRNLGQHRKAVFHYRIYLARLPDAPNRRDVQELIALSQAALDRRSRPGGAHRAWFWSGVSAAGALLVTGTITGALNLSMSSEYKDPATSVERRLELKDTGEALGVVSAVTLATGTALAVTTAFLYFYTDFREGDRVALSPAPTGGMITVTGRF